MRDLRGVRDVRGKLRKKRPQGRRVEDAAPYHATPDTVATVKLKPRSSKGGGAGGRKSDVLSDHPSAGCSSANDENYTKITPPLANRMSANGGLADAKATFCRFSENGVQRPEFRRRPVRQHGSTGEIRCRPPRSSRREAQTGIRSVASDSPPARIGRHGNGAPEKACSNAPRRSDLIRVDS